MELVDLWLSLSYLISLLAREAHFALFAFIYLVTIILISSLLFLCNRCKSIPDSMLWKELQLLEIQLISL